MKLRFVWIAALKDFRRRLKDPVALLLWLGLPLLIGGLLGLVIDGPGSGATPRAKLLLVDQDESFLSELLVGAGSGAGEDVPIEIVSVELEEGLAQIDEGEASGLVVLPEGFGEALLEGTALELELLTNPAQRILPKILEEALTMLVDAAFYLQRVLGAELQALAAGPPGGASFFTNAVVAAQAASINDRLQRLDGVLFPPLLDFEVEVVGEEEPQPLNIGLLLFPGMLFLAMLFIAQGTSGDLWQEKLAGTLQRNLQAPVGLAAYLLGKLLSGAILIAAVTAVGLAFGALLFDFPAAGLFPAFLWGSFAGLALLPLFSFLQILGSTQQAGNVLTTVLLFPLMMLGGSLFPFEAMPDWMVVVGQWTPNGLASARFQELLEGDVDLGELARSGGLLLAFGLALFFLTLRRAGGRFLAS